MGIYFRQIPSRSKLMYYLLPPDTPTVVTVQQKQRSQRSGHSEVVSLANHHYNGFNDHNGQNKTLKQMNINTLDQLSAKCVRKFFTDK